MELNRLGHFDIDCAFALNSHRTRVAEIRPMIFHPSSNPHIFTLNYPSSRILAWVHIRALILITFRKRHERISWICSKAYVRLDDRSLRLQADAKFSQVRGKKNLVIEKSLAGPIGIFVKFSTLQDHGVDKVFFLENDNVDASQKNVIFLARGEKANQPIAVAGMYVLDLLLLHSIYF